MLLALLVSACGPSEQTVTQPARRLHGDSPLVEVFVAAEQRTGVPAELLATIAYLQTRLREPPGDHEGHGHAPREWGIMAIGTGGLTSLDAAAEAAGLSPHDVATDAQANVLGAAALLARTGATASAEAGAIGPWLTAVEAYGGEPLATAVAYYDARGWHADDTEGQAIWLTPAGAEDGVGQVTQDLSYPGSIWSPAHYSNYTNASRGGAQINYVVIHTTQGSYAGAISWFKNPSSNVSSHYVVRSSDGQITAMVDDSDIAWHDACFNSQSIGIEHEGYVQNPGQWYTPAMYAASAKLTSWLCDTYGIPKDRQHIMGHGETPDCSDHTDPGGGWDWNYYMSLVKSGGCECSPGQKQTDGCGNCGTRTRTCGGNCKWGGWSSCQGQGPCAPGTKQTEACCDCGEKSRSCNGSCQWGGWSGCAGPDPLGACDTGELGPCAPGTVRCVGGCKTCKRDYEPVPELCDAFDNDCTGVDDDGFPTVMGDPPPPFAARLMDVSYPRHLGAGEVGQAWATFLNEGSSAWKPGEIWLASLPATELEQSSLYDADSWPAWDVAAVLGELVAPGERGTLAWSVRAPRERGAVIREPFRLEDPEGALMRCPSPEIDVEVRVGTATPLAEDEEPPPASAASTASCSASAGVTAVDPRFRGGDDRDSRRFDSSRSMAAWLGLFAMGLLARRRAPRGCTRERRRDGAWRSAGGA